RRHTSFSRDWSSDVCSSDLFRNGKIPRIPVYIDSPLAIEATTVFRLHPDIFDQTERLVESDSPLFDFSLVSYTRDVEESKRLNKIGRESCRERVEITEQGEG